MTDPATLGRLLLIGAMPGLSQAEFARFVGRQKHGLTPHMQALDERGLIDRLPEPGNRYALHLTDEGRAVIDRFIGSYMEKRAGQLPEMGDA